MFEVYHLDHSTSSRPHHLELFLKEYHVLDITRLPCQHTFNEVITTVPVKTYKVQIDYKDSLMESTRICWAPSKKATPPCWGPQKIGVSETSAAGGVRAWHLAVPSQALYTYMAPKPMYSERVNALAIVGLYCAHR